MIQEIARYIFWFIALCWLTWVCFCALMALQKVRADGNLKGLAKWFGYVLLIIFVPLDFFLNLVATVLFIEFPRYRSGEWLVTARMKRYYNQVVTNPDCFEKWRKIAGKFITEALLNNVSTSVGDGNHV